MGNVKIIGASAGSGKTYRLAYEYVKNVVGDPSLYRHILAVTFTNKATEEMRSRILERLHELAGDGPSPYLVDLLRDLAPLDEHRLRARAAEAERLILHDYSRFAVLTIDRFFQRLIRGFIRELGVEVNFNLELETDSLLALAADALIEQSAGDEELRERLFAASRDNVDDNKRWDIKEPLMELGRELFGEGCRQAPENASTLLDALAGRAREVQGRFASIAREMLRITDERGLTTGDFKGKSRGLVPWLGKAARGEFMPLNSYVRQELEGDSLPPELASRLAELDALYNDNFRLVGSVRLLHDNHHNFLLLADLQRHVERICTEENIMPISETNRIIARLVAGNDTPFIFEKAGSYFSRFFIDEFQDTSSMQWDNFVPLLKNAIAGEKGSPVMLIGDIKQAIYRWRGGDWRILSRRVREDMGEGRVESETLGVNYRSMRRVVEFNNNAIGLIAGAGNDALNDMVRAAAAQGAIDPPEAARLSDMLAEAYEVHTQQPGSTDDEGYVTLTVYEADARGNYVPPLVEKIEELQSRGYAPDDIAVLVRTNDQGAKVARMLLERKHNNPDSPYRYDVVTAEALTVGAAEVSRFIIACLSLAADPGDVIRRAVYNKWLGRDFDADLGGDASFFARLASLSPEDAFEETVLRFALDSRTADIAYIQAVHQQIIAFSSRKIADIPLFLKWWNEKGARASISMQGGRAGAITVSTIHKSKGLQYRVVIVPYLSWKMAPETSGRRLVVWTESSEEGLDRLGAMPIVYRSQMSESYFAPGYYNEQVLAHIDALNMFYVAITRAEDELHLMTSDNSRNGQNSIGNILRGVLGVGKGTGEVMTFGAPLYPARDLAATGGENATGGTGIVLCGYRTSPPAAKVGLRLPSTRYFEDGGVELLPRDVGVSMHRAFENAAGIDDVHLALDRMRAGAQVSQAEYAHLKGVVERALENPLIAAWFGGEWAQVRNESDIVVPGRSGTKRPDRVMISGESAVVVDYKFGRRMLPTHTSQLRDYMRLLSDMGYAPVEGYLWYVSLDRIEKVIV